MNNEELLEELKRRLDRAEFLARQNATDSLYLRKAGERACGEAVELKEDVDRLRTENERLRDSVRHYESAMADLQTQNGILKNQLEDYRKAHNRMVGELESKEDRGAIEQVKWWRHFSEETRQKVYSDLGCTESRLPSNSAKNVARTLLQALADRKVHVPEASVLRVKIGELEKELVKVSETAFNYKQANKSLESELRHKRDLCEVNGRSLHELQMENGRLQQELGEARDRVGSLNKALDDYTLSCGSCRKVARVIHEEWVCKDCHKRAKDHAHQAIDEEAAVAKAFDDFVDRVLDVMEPEYYDPDAPAAQSGYDYEAIIKGLKKMKALALNEDPAVDFAERIAGFLAHGMTDEEIWARLEESEGPGLVCLLRKFMEKK